MKPLLLLLLIFLIGCGPEPAGWDYAPDFERRYEPMMSFEECWLSIDNSPYGCLWRFDRNGDGIVNYVDYAQMINQGEQWRLKK